MRACRRRPLLTATAVVAQPLSGLALVHAAGYALGDSWIVVSLLLYVGVGLCWLPVVWLQMRMSRLASAASYALPKASSSWAIGYWLSAISCQPSAGTRQLVPAPARVPTDDLGSAA